MQRDYWPDKKWLDKNPAALGMDSEMLSALEPLIKSQYGNINGIVVVRNGYIAYERYFHGYGPDDTHHVASVTKSVISALIGIAIDRGYIDNLDRKALDFFPDYHIADEEGKKGAITLRHLLTMTVPYPFPDWREPLDRLCMQADWVRYALDMMGRDGEIGVFKYSTTGAHLLSAIITRSTGKSAREFANQYLFQPIGMKVIPDHKMASFGFDDLFGKNVRGWVKDPQGNSTGGWGLTLSPRDMARFGFLYLNRGIWDGRQIITEKWIEESVATNKNHYGYMWWLREEDGVFAYLALGNGGHAICCVPEKDLVVAITSAFIMNPRDRWTLIKNHILPALID